MNTASLTLSALARACVLALVLAGCSKPEAPKTSAQPVFVTAVRNDRGAELRSFSGVLRPRYETEVGFRAGGKVTQRLVEVGQSVAAGQVLARLDPADYALGVSAAADQAHAAKVDADQAASDEARFHRLLADGSVGAADHERQKARADAALARYQQAQKQLELARNRVGYASLVAPYAGVVTALRAEVGQVVNEGQPVLALAKPGEVEVEVQLPEQLASQLAGWKAHATLWGRSDLRLELKLRELAPVAAAQGRTFRARFSLVQPPAALLSQLKLGMTADLVLMRGGTAQVAALPVSALIKTQGEPGVWLVNATAGTVTRQTVKVVGYAQDLVLLAGLPDGAQVISVGAQKVDAGMQVRPVQRSLAQGQTGGAL